MAVAMLAAGAAQASTLPPKVTAKAALVADAETGEVIFALNPDVQLPPASTTKILTALVAVRMGDLDREVLVSRDASRAEPSKIWLKPGWRMRAEDLLYAILLNSANDASIALAEGLGGSVSDFSRLMTSTAHELGAMRSNFVNPSGLPDQQHYSTVRDLVTIMRHTLQRPLLRQVLSTPSTVIRPRRGSQRRIALRSHNRFLSRRDVRVIGKTGWTRRAKRCFVGAASVEGREVLVAVLGSVDLWGDLDRLIAFGLAQPSESPRWPSGTEWVEATRRDDSDWRAAVREKAPAAKAVDVTTAKPATVAQGADRKGFRYEVHVAAFRSKAQADRLQRQVAAQGYRATVARLRTRRPLFRVTVVGFQTRASAREAVRVLSKAHRVDPQIVAVRA